MKKHTSPIFCVLMLMPILQVAAGETNPLRSNETNILIKLFRHPTRKLAAMVAISFIIFGRATPSGADVPDPAVRDRLRRETASQKQTRTDF